MIRQLTLIEDKETGEAVNVILLAFGAFEAWYRPGLDAFWTHVVTSSGQDYVDGVAKGPGDKTVAAARFLVDRKMFQAISDVETWDRPLSEQEIRERYRS